MNCNNCECELKEVQGGVGHKNITFDGGCLCGCFQPEKEKEK